MPISHDFGGEVNYRAFARDKGQKPYEKDWSVVKAGQKFVEWWNKHKRGEEAKIEVDDNEASAIGLLLFQRFFETRIQRSGQRHDYGGHERD